VTGPGLYAPSVKTRQARAMVGRAPHRPLRPGPREWLRWVSGWTRGRLGHSWAREGQEVLCRGCGALARVAPHPAVPMSWPSFDDGPAVLRRRFLRALGANWDCAESQVRQVMES